MSQRELIVPKMSHGNGSVVTNTSGENGSIFRAGVSADVGKVTDMWKRGKRQMLWANE